MRLFHHTVLAGLLAMVSLLPACSYAAGKAIPTPTNTFATLWQPGWACGQATRVKPDFVRHLANSHALQGYALNGVPLPILLGQNPEQSGAILFAKHDGIWQAYPIADGSVVLAAYSTPAFNRVTLFATGGREGLGNDYLVLQGKNQFSEFGCATVHFPAELDRPDWNNRYPGLHDFNMDTQGRGTLITAANVPAGNAEVKHWYQYVTNDWGRSWSEARNLKGKPADKQGIFYPLKETSPSPWLMKSLLNSTP